MGAPDEYQERGEMAHPSICPGAHPGRRSREGRMKHESGALLVLSLARRTPGLQRSAWQTGYGGPGMTLVGE
jgi:hypothetical protein